MVICATKPDRTINDAQAEVVRRIFRDYAAGKSAKAIAFALNKEGVPAPSGGDWGFSTINGNPKRRNGSSTTRCMSARSSGTVSAS
ncbi:recombinase family protein [Novosphingobium beihaiensis]|uniref:recombinase family protein n=1 Tax=Novosphingobium beihaiensis TaxID=2930389 RepID=UPI0022841A43|nr:recombinase family protein [Novosphingobium beihaiensis]